MGLLEAAHPYGMPPSLQAIVFVSLDFWHWNSLPLAVFRPYDSPYPKLAC